MAAALTVTCVYKPGNGFTDEYVYRLREGIARHLQTPHRFVVLTNRRFEDFETIPLEPGVDGWWNKLALWRANQFTGRVWYFDLDTMIVGDITDIVEVPQEFAMLRDFYHPERAASGLMAWNADLDWSHLTHGFTRQASAQYMTKERWGDQGWVSERLLDRPLLLQDQFPGRIASYKVERKKQGKMPDTASIICFHGKPRPADIGWRLP